MHHFVDDGRKQTSQGDIDPDGRGGNQNAEVNVPTKNDLHHDGHGEHVDPAHQHSHGCERQGGEQPRSLAVAKLQVSGYRVRLRHVIKGDHHNAEEQHRRNRADPVPVRGQHAVLISRSRPAQQFERAQVGGDETQAGHPGPHALTSKEEVIARPNPALQVHSNSQHQREVQTYDKQIGWRQAKQP